MRESISNGLVVCCIVGLIVGGLAFATMGPEIKAATNAGCTQRGWQPVFEEPEPETCSWSHTFSLEDTVATETGIAENFSFSGDIVIVAQEPSNGVHTNFYAFSVIAGLTPTIWPASEGCVIYVFNEPGGDPLLDQAIELTIGETYTFPFAITLTNSHLCSTHTTDPIGEKGTTHAKECALAEAWYITNDTEIVVTCGNFNPRTYDWPYAVGPLAEIPIYMEIWVGGYPGNWDLNAVNVAFTNLSAAGQNINCDELNEAWGSPAVMLANGGGANIELYRTGATSGANMSWQGGIWAPRSYSFAGLDVIDRDGNSHSDALVWNTGVREWDGEGNPICPVCKTVAEWQAYDHTQARGCYSWEKGDPDLNASVTLYIDRDWAREAGLDGFTADEYATKSFGHDARIIINGWTIDKEDRDCVPYRDDILSIAHKSGQSIYADDQDHTDWALNGNCSDPDSDGDFTVTAAGAQQTFTLKNNREARLGGLVQALQAPAGVPDAYITYQHDYYLTAENYPETTHESVYCWKGWRYLYMQVRPPIGTTGQTAQVVLEVDYHDSESHSDPHVSDSTRQTDYSYSLGTLHTRTFIKQVPRTELYTNLCFDLGDLQPMLIVKAIRLKVEQVGTWSLDEPRLALDTGDVLAEREFVSPHCYAKEFEAFPYQRGGISAVVDGVALGSMEWPDTSHENTLEHTGGHFDYVVGATSGKDMTNAVSLAGYASWMLQCSDAWNAGVNPTAALAATSDGTNVLKTLSAYDVCPTNKQGLDSGSLRVAIRVGTFTAAPGIHYTFCAEKITGGKSHGCIFTSAGRSASDIADVVRRLPGGEWATAETALSTNGHGYWESDDLTVYSFTDGTGTLYEYGLRDDADEITSLGRAATREWTLFDEIVAAIGIHPQGHSGAHGRMYLVARDADSNIRIVKRTFCKPWQAGRDTGFASTAGDISEWPGLAHNRQAWSNAILHGESGLTINRGAAECAKWTVKPAYETELSIKYPSSLMKDYSGAIAGYDGTNHVITRWNWYREEPTETTVIAAGDDGPGALCYWPIRGHFIYALPSGDDIKLYRSTDKGSTWEYETTLTGLQYPSLSVQRVNMCIAAYDTETGNAAFERRKLKDWSQITNIAGTIYGRVQVGPSNEDRSAVIYDPKLWRINYIVPDGTDLKDYTSKDRGRTFAYTQTLQLA